MKKLSDLVEMHWFFKPTVTLAVVLLGDVIIPPVTASTVLVASSAGESADAGPALVRRINDESEFVHAAKVVPQPEWTTLGLPAPWVSRTADYPGIPDDVVLEFMQEFYIPAGFEVEFGLLVMLSAFTSFSTLNGFQLTSPIFYPGESCARPSPGSPGCADPFAVDVTPFLVPGTNVFVSQALGIAGSGIAHAWEFNVYGNVKAGHGVPEPGYLWLLGAAVAIGVYLRRSRTETVNPSLPEVEIAFGD